MTILYILAAIVIIYCIGTIWLYIDSYHDHKFGKSWTIAGMWPIFTALLIYSYCRDWKRARKIMKVTEIRRRENW